MYTKMVSVTELIEVRCMVCHNDYTVEYDEEVGETNGKCLYAKVNYTRKYRIR